MEEDANVFSSDITRGQKPLQNNLYELIKVVPALPTTTVCHDKNDECDFQPKTDKLYVPKRKTKPIVKVKTVRDIRKLFESDVYPDLSKDAERQQNYLLKKITCGSIEKTKSVATSMLKCDKPISRVCWQMLTNLNPHGCVNAIQYVLWNGRCIRVSGSRGGKNKFLCNYDLEKNRKVAKAENRKKCNKRPGLLRNSLNIKFKPGPLSKKRILDDSYQKFNVGDINIVNLPKPGLDIQPRYGIPLEPTITKFVHSLRDVHGDISEKWAEFSVSVLGAIKNKELIQNNHDAAVSFEFNYKYDQRQMLMRRDFGACAIEEMRDTTISDSENINAADINSEVELILNQIVHSVEISLQQDTMYTGEDEEREVSVKVNTGEVHAPKDKNKKRFAELDRLDVTVIRLPEAPEDDISNACNNAHCSLGCVCSSLQRSFNLKQHCGRLECMFQCKCDFSKYKALDLFENGCAGLLPGLINLDKEINLNLAKEEQKFHQTVVMTAEKSIVLKSERRNWKATKRYSNFYGKMCLKSDVKRRELLAVVDVKLNLDNVEPWCMVHNMYKCFCKGVFTQDVNLDLMKDKTDESKIPHEEEDSIKNNPDIKVKSRTRTEKKSEEGIGLKQTNVITKSLSDDSIIHLDLLIEGYEYSTCARTKQYEGRKYSPAHYLNANKRILEMEANDDKLRKRMNMILYKQSKDYKSEPQNKLLDESIISVHNKDSSFESHDENSRSESLSGAIMDSSSSDCSGLFTGSTSSSKGDCAQDRSILNHTTNKTKLIAWLEASYKQYKNRVEQGVFKKSLEPPKHGKVALYPWEFILNRYKERKNLFLVSKEKPFRIFMAVDAKNNFFNNCMNIDDIRFADLYQYPATVKNLLTYATDLKDNFCILCGWSHCWELIGSVTKVDEQSNEANEENSNNILEVTMNQPPTKTESQESTKEAVKKTNALRRSQRKRTKKRKFDATSSEDDAKGVNLVTPESSKDSNDSTICEPVSSDKNYATLEELLNRPVMPDVELLKEKSLSVNDLDEEKKNMELSDTSKWFVMTVENDFSEIQFYQRGFFVKYESIIKAINVARLSEKTVRLSSQKSGDLNAGPQFGIYAVPNADEYYVFIGPYEKDEPLGIETVTTFAEIVKTKRTKGVWIFTKKMDNIRVIDNPLAFMPSKDIQPIKLVHIEDQLSKPSETIVSQKQPDLDNDSTEPQQKDQVKVVKPIKIRKTDGFYQLAGQGVFKACGSSKPVMGKSILQPILLKNMESNQLRQTTTTLVPVPSSVSLNPSTSACPKNQTTAKKRVASNPKPIAEIAPQIKIVDVFSQASKPQSVVSIRPERGMLVLKPEEINSRVMKNIIVTETLTDNAQTGQQAMGLEQQPEELDQDIENFLATSSVFVPPNADIFEISDDDDDDPEARRNNWSTVWIDCVNINLGYLRARKNMENRISFEFPGFKFTDFYEEQEAFSKINQVLSRKIYVPKKINLQWRVVESADELANKKKLTAAELGADFALTRQGLRHKRLLLAGLREERQQPASTPATNLLKLLTSDNKSTPTTEDIDKAIEVTTHLDEQCKSLVEEGEVLFTQMVNAHGQSGSKLFDIQEADHTTLQTISDSLHEISETG